ncbi:MAG: response regulator [Chloroflexi bacterium]|nr:response regulator [Chloroflexota bacterium]
MAEKQGTILIVDDEEAIRRLIAQRLEREGYRCHLAENVDQALAVLNNGAFDLAIMDIKMPGRTGLELLPLVKANYPDTAVIMLTAIADVTTAIDCMRQGAYDYLTKPFNLEAVSLSVGRALQMRRLQVENRDYQANLEQKVAAQASRIRLLYVNAITALAAALEAKDHYTSGHSEVVARTSVAIAREMGLSPKEVEKIRIAGLIHDIGKIGVKESVLNKPARLTEEEYQHIKRHSEMGEHILTPIVEDNDIMVAVRHHHEHYDGSGYPDGLAGDSIPLTARILAVADAYDAMTSERPYRKALPAEVACAEITRCAGTQFDPAVVDCLLRLKKPAKAV